MQLLQTKVEHILVTLLLIWLITMAAVVKVGEAIASGHMHPDRDPWSTMMAARPDLLWSMPAAMGALLGTSLAAFGYSRRLTAPTAFQPALIVIAASSLMGFALSGPFGQNGALYATYWVTGLTRSQAYSGGALGFLAALMCIDAHRRKDPRRALWFGVVAVISMGLLVYAIRLYEAFEPWLDLPVFKQLALEPLFVPLLVIGLTVIAITVVLMERYLRLLSAAIHGSLLCAIFGTTLYLGREAIEPTPPVTRFTAVGYDRFANVSSPWSDTADPLPPRFERAILTEFEARDRPSYFEEDAYSTTEDLRRRFSDTRERSMVVPKSVPRIVVFASEETPLRVIAHAVLDARSEGLAVELGVVRTTRQIRPILGPMVSFDAGVLPGAADRVVAASVDHETWGDWLSDRPAETHK
jgi:hypothetical protein